VSRITLRSEPTDLGSPLEFQSNAVIGADGKSVSRSFHARTNSARSRFGLKRAIASRICMQPRGAEVSSE